MTGTMDTPPDGGNAPAPTPTEPMPSRYMNWGPANKVVIALAVVLLLGAVGTAGYFYKQLNDVKKNPNKIAADETNATISAIGKLIVLPTDEQPTLATVTDPSKLADQPFFALAKAGDKVLIYTNAKKAILYDPVANKIVEVAPVNIGSTAAAPSAVSGASTTDSSKTPPKK